MKKIFGVFILLVLMLCGGLSPTVFNNTLNAYNINFSQKSESSTHDFEEDLYKHYYIKEENNFYYINLQTNKIEHYNFGSITSFGEYGNTDGKFANIKFFKVLKNGEFMVLDSLNRLQFFSSNFAHLKTLQHIKNGNNLLPLGNISSVAQDIYSNVYLIDYTNGFILKANSGMENLEVVSTSTFNENSNLTILNTSGEIVTLTNNVISKSENTTTTEEDAHFIFSDAQNYIYVVLNTQILKLDTNLNVVGSFKSNIGREYNINLENGYIYYILNNAICLIKNFATDISSYTPPVDVNSTTLNTSPIQVYSLNAETSLKNSPYSQVGEKLSLGTLVLVLGKTTEFENNFYYVYYSQNNDYALGYIEQKYLQKQEIETLNTLVIPVRSDVKYYKYPSLQINVLQNNNLNLNQTYQCIRKITYNNTVFAEILIDNNYVYVLNEEVINKNEAYINTYLATNSELKLYNNHTEINIYNNIECESIICTLNKNTKVKIISNHGAFTKVSFIYNNNIITGFVENKFVVKQQKFIIPLTIILITTSIVILIVIILKYKKELARKYTKSKV